MKREIKYPDTDTFTYYNANPHNRKSGDCVIRAICTALDESWEDTLTGLFEIAVKAGYTPTDKHTIEKYLISKGWHKNKQPRKADGTKYTGLEFCRMFSGVCIAKIGCHHIVAIKGGKVLDIWDSTDGCIGNYWTK